MWKLSSPELWYVSRDFSSRYSEIFAPSTGHRLITLWFNFVYTVSVCLLLQLYLIYRLNFICIDDLKNKLLKSYTNLLYLASIGGNTCLRKKLWSTNLIQFFEFDQNQVTNVKAPPTLSIVEGELDVFAEAAWVVVHLRLGVAKRLQQGVHLEAHGSS